MRDERSRRVVRLGDATDHGGVVKTAVDGFKVLGVPVAAEGCLVACPRCGGDFGIVTPLPGRKHLGRTIAHEGDLTECGAVLIASYKDG